MVGRLRDIPVVKALLSEVVREPAETTGWADFTEERFYY
jgi:hypothetical protein